MRKARFYTQNLEAGSLTINRLGRRRTHKWLPSEENLCQTHKWLPSGENLSKFFLSKRREVSELYWKNASEKGSLMREGGRKGILCSWI